MVKALSTAGLNELETKEGRRIPWRQQTAARLLDLQRPDGSWYNDNGRWWEKDPCLVTAYAVLALEMLHRSL